MNHLWDYELPIADISYIKDLLKHCKEIWKETGNTQKALQYFFSFGLLGYYDCMWDGMRVEAGHVLYRLSDLIDKSEREKIEVYPSRCGSLTVDESGYSWDSLEDWRKLWEESHPTIPQFDFQKKLVCLLSNNP